MLRWTNFRIDIYSQVPSSSRGWRVGGNSRFWQNLQPPPSPLFPQFSNFLWENHPPILLLNFPYLSILRKKCKRWTWKIKPSNNIILKYNKIFYTLHENILSPCSSFLPPKKFKKLCVWFSEVLRGQWIETLVQYGLTEF